MQASECFGQAFIIASQTAKPRYLANATLNHPASRQQHNTFLGSWQLDDFKPYAVGFSVLSHLLAGVALVNKSNFNRFVGCHVHALSKFRHLCALLLIAYPNNHFPSPGSLSQFGSPVARSAGVRASRIGS